LNLVPGTLEAAQASGIIEREAANRRQVRFWLYAVCLLIFSMVLVGGATRLTDSGLSITEWKPVHGTIPPLSVADWQDEFEKYQQIPEYQEINKGMSLDEFKTIYWWEWSHRQLGRFIGLAVALPLAFFWLSGRLEPGLKPRLLLLLGFGGLQGFIGWWMVASGLVERTDVSQIRLAVHLTLAIAILAYAMWIARGLAPHSAGAAHWPLRTAMPLVFLILFLQIFLGGLVAGLDAGLAFNDWPTMDGAWVPGGLMTLEPYWRNIVENTKAVQYAHRICGYLLLISAFFQWVVAARTENASTHRLRAMILFLLAAVQASIGILTLVLQVPFALALLHQAGAVILVAFATAHWRALIGPYPPITAIETRS
jgi:heme a synthase